jgi:hypothetical protein
MKLCGDFRQISNSRIRLGVEDHASEICASLDEPEN